MFAKQLNELAQRKRLLVLEADLYRSRVDLECASLRVQFNSAFTTMRGGSPWLIAGGAAAGLLVARHWRGLAHWVESALTVWRWVQRLK